MISKKAFIKLLEQYSEFNKMEEKVRELFRIDYFESPMIEIPWQWFEKLLDVYVKPEYRELVSAYIWPEENIDWNIWDRPEHPLYLYDSEGEKVENVIATYEDLYNYLKANDGFNTNC